MRAPGHQTTTWTSRYSLVASGLFHAAIFLLAILIASPNRLPRPSEESVSVEIVFDPLTVPSEAVQTVGPTEAAEEQASSENRIVSNEPHPASTNKPKTASADEQPRMIRPSRMLSAKVLSDPRSRKARKELALLSPPDQVEQLCGLEAMAQVGIWSETFRPDRIVAYAMADPQTNGNSFLAKGAALHSGRAWYALEFKCDLTEDRKKVVSFEFRVGEAIPREDWAEHNLPDEDTSVAPD